MSRKAWGWKTEWDIPNANLYREPWGFYLRTKRWRITAGPLYSWSIQRCWRVPWNVQHPIKATRWKWAAFKSRKYITIYYRTRDGIPGSKRIDRVPSRHGRWWYSEERKLRMKWKNVGTMIVIDPEKVHYAIGDIHPDVPEGFYWVWDPKVERWILISDEE